MKSNLKIAPAPLTPAREALRDAIAEVDATQKAAEAAQQSVELAHAKLREKERAHGIAKAALEEARAPRKSLAEKLADARGEEEQWAAVEEHKAEAGRPAVTVDDLKRLRAVVESADDEVVAARSSVDRASTTAGPPAAALRRARDKRERAVWELVRPEVGRLMRECQDLLEELSAKRAELNYVSNGLINPLEGDRRSAYHYLGRQLFPEEAGLHSENDLTRRTVALAAWSAFAEGILKDASTPFPAP